MPNWNKVVVSGSDAALKSLNLINPTSGATVLDIQGTQGQLFSITDDLTGDIFSVSDISGVPILNVNADGTTTIDGPLTLTNDETLDTTSDTSIKFLTRDSNGVVKYHSLGSNAFNSTTIPTNNNQLANGAGYITTNTVDMGDGFKIANSAGTDQFTVTENEEIRFAGSGATSVAFDSSTQKVTISSTDTNTDTNTFRNVTAGGNTLGGTESLDFIAGSNVSISESGGNVTISSTDTNTDTNTVTSIRRDNTGTYRTGNINLIGGTNVSISETSAGVFNISSTDTNTIYVHPTSAGNKHIPTGGAAGQFLKYSSSGTATWATPSYTTNTDTQNTAAEIRTKIGSGNNGHVPTTGTAGHFLKHDGTFGLPSYTTNTDTNTQNTAAEIRTKIGSGNNGHVPTVGSAGQFLKHDGTFGTPSYTTNTDTNTNQLTTFQVEDGDGTEVTISHGKEWKFTEGGGIDVNWTDVTPGSNADPFDLQFAIKANGVRASELNVSGNGSTSQFLRSAGDGSFTWATPIDTNTIYVHPTSAGNKHIPTGGAAGQFLKYSSSGTATWATPSYTTNTDTQNTAAEIRTKIGSGNNGHVPTTGTAGHFLKHDGTFGLPSYTTNTDTNTVTSIRRDNTGTYRTGNINLIGGTNVSISETSAGVFNISSTDTNTQVTNNNQITNGAGYRTSAQVNTAVDARDDFAPMDDDGRILLDSTDGIISTDSSFTFDNSILTTPALTIGSIAAQTSEATSLMINTSGVVGTRELGSNAFNSTTIPTNNNQLANGAGYITTNTVDMGDGFKIANSAGTDQFTVTENEEIRFAGSGATSVAFDSSTQKVTISSTDTNTNTTYSATGNGLAITGTVFSHKDTSTAASVNGSGNTVVQDIALDEFGHVTALGTTTIVVPSSQDILDEFTAGDGINIDSSGIISSTVTDTNTTYSADGNYGMTLSGTTFRLEDDRRRNSTSAGIYTGNTHDFTYYNPSAGIMWYTAGAAEMLLTNAGTLHVDGDIVAFSTSISDARLKDNVTTIENPLDKIKALRGVEYDWNGGSRKGTHDLGLIAQEVEKVIPNIVHEHEQPFLTDDLDDKTLYKTVDYEKLTAVLIEGMKEQQIQIDSMKSEINELKGRL